MDLKMNKYIIIGIVSVLLLLSLFQLAKINTISSQIAAGNVVASSSAGSGGNLDTTGWTADEKMNYEMHGIIPARAGGGSSPGNTQMVGGC
jgi:hypothetical protein